MIYFVFASSLLFFSSLHFAYYCHFFQLSLLITKSPPLPFIPHSSLFHYYSLFSDLSMRCYSNILAKSIHTSLTGSGSGIWERQGTGFIGDYYYALI